MMPDEAERKKGREGGREQGRKEERGKAGRQAGEISNYSLALVVFHVALASADILPPVLLTVVSMQLNTCTGQLPSTNCLFPKLGMHP